jgi:hypothetical protein
LENLETEAKYILPKHSLKSVIEWFRERDNLSHGLLRERLHHYFDTSEFQLHERGNSFRKRDRKFSYCLKINAASDVKNLTTRREFFWKGRHAPSFNDIFFRTSRLGHVLASELRLQHDAISVCPELKPIVSIYAHRICHKVIVPGHVVPKYYLSFDNVTAFRVDNPEIWSEWCELEVEVNRTNYENMAELISVSKNLDKFLGVKSILDSKYSTALKLLYRAELEK